MKDRAMRVIDQQGANEIRKEVDRWKADVEGILRPVANEFHSLITVVA